MIGFSKLSDYRLSDYKLSDFLVENTWPFKPIAFEESVIFVINNGNRTEWTPIRSLIIRVINKIRRPRSGSPFCLITSMITDRIGRDKVLLPLNHNHCNFRENKSIPLFVK